MRWGLGVAAVAFAGVVVGAVWTASIEALSGDVVSVESAPEEDHVGRSEPVIGTGVMEVLVARDGAIVGMLITQDSTLGWQQHGHTSTVTGHATLSADQFYCIGLDGLSGAYLYHEVELGPGAYEAFAVSRM